jgi:hypothetical protein
MKLRLAFASMMVLATAACGTSPDALQALQAMQILEDNPSAGISYDKLSGSGNDVTLTGVTFNAPGDMMAAMAAPPAVAGEAAAPAPAAPAGPMAVATAQSLKINGLTMKEGRPVFRDMVLSSITPTMQIPGGTVSIASVALEGLNEATGKFVAGGFTKEGPGETPPFEQWAVGKAAINGIKVVGPIPMEEGQPAGAINFELGEFSVANLKDTMVGLTRLSGIKGDFSVPGQMPIAGKFDLGAMDFSNIRAGMYVRAFEAGMASAMREPGAPPVDYASVFAEYTSPLEYGLDRATWTGMKADVSGVKLDASPASYTATRNKDGVVVATTSPRSTFTLTADSSGGMAGAMGLMVLAMGGYPSNVIEFYTQGDASFDPAKDMTRYTNYNFGVTDVFDIKAEGGLLGLQKALPTLLAGIMSSMDSLGPMMAESDKDEDDGAEGEEEESGDGDDADAADGDDAGPDMPPEMQQMMATMVMGLISLQVTDLDISITDKQLVGLILNQTASQSGQSVAAYRADLVNMINGSAVFLTDAGIDPALANEATAAISGFLGGPGTLRIQLKPKMPIGMMTAMMSPTKESLGFSATFTPAAAQ